MNIKLIFIFILAFVILQTIPYYICLSRNNSYNNNNDQRNIPSSHLAHPLLKLASEVFHPPSQSITIIFEDININTNNNIDFLRNTILEVKKVGIHSFIVIATNQPTCSLLLEEERSRCYYPILPNNTVFQRVNNNVSRELEAALKKSYVWAQLVGNGYNVFSITSSVLLKDNPLLVFIFCLQIFNLIMIHCSTLIELWTLTP